MKSIIQSNKECFLCRHLYGIENPYGLEYHHCIFGRGNMRKLADKHGLTVWLCIEHHRTSKEAVHVNADMARICKRAAQEAFEACHDRAEWMDIFNKNYL